MKKAIFDQVTDLTPRELIVLGLMAWGLTNNDIAKKTHLSVKTIEKMLGKEDVFRGIYAKLGVHNRPQATTWYTKMRTSYRLLQDYARDTISKMRQVRMQGEARLCIQWGQELATAILNEIKINPIAASYPKPLLKKRGWVLFEILIAKAEISLPEEFMTLAEELVKEIRVIAKECGDKELFGLADYALGLAFYIRGRWRASLEALYRARGAIENNGHKLMVLRILALNLAYLKNETEFKKIQTQMGALIETGNFSDLQFVCLALEGLGRGQGLFKLPAAYDTLADGWGIHTQIKGQQNKLPLRSVQLARSELEVICCLQPTDKQLLETRAQEGLRLARYCGYPRYVARIEELSAQYLH